MNRVILSFPQKYSSMSTPLEGREVSLQPKSYRILSRQLGILPRHHFSALDQSVVSFKNFLYCKLALMAFDSLREAWSHLAFIKIHNFAVQCAHSHRITMATEREQNCSLECSHLHLRLSNIQSHVVQEKLIEDLESLLQDHQGSLDFVILEGNMSQIESTTVAKALLRIFDILGCIHTFKYLWMEFEESIIPAEVLARCLMSANALSSLHLVGVRISGSTDDVSILTASIKALSYLKRVDLIDCKALNPNVSLEPMIKALSTATTLEKVTLLTVCPPSLSSSDELLAEFCRSTSLKTLFWIQLMRTKDDDIVKMAKSLHGNDTLRELVIFSDVAGAKAGKAIGEMLTTNKSLKRLTCFLKDFHHALPIAKALETNASLSNLRIKSVGPAVPQDVVRRFCKMLESNCTVTSLDLCHFVPEIDLYLRLNKAGRRNLLTGDNLFRWEGWAKCVLSNTKDLDILFYLLEQNPAFVGNLSATMGP